MKKLTKQILLSLTCLLACIGVSNKAEANVDNCCFDSRGFLQNFYVDVEFLYWKARQDDIPYAATGFDSDVRGDTFEVDWKWKPGFRLGAGYLFDCDAEISLIYTWYKNNAFGSFSGVEDALAIWEVSGILVPNGSADWHLKFQTLDLLLKKSLCFWNCFDFAPFIGLKGGYLRDTYNIFYGGDSDATINNRERVRVIGPEIGFHTGYAFCRNLSIIGEAAFSSLWADYEIHRIDTPGPASIDPTFNNIRHTFNTVRFVPEYRVGIQWDYCLCGCYDLRLLAAWEQQIWFNYNQMLYGPLNFDQLILNRDSNLNLYGLTLRAQLLF